MIESLKRILFYAQVMHGHHLDELESIFCLVIIVLELYITYTHSTLTYLVNEEIHILFLEFFLHFSLDYCSAYVSVSFCTSCLFQPS